MSASHFLVPEETARRLQARRSSTVVFKLKSIFLVSYRTVLYRSEDLDASAKQRLWTRFNAEYRRRFGRAPARTKEPGGLAADAFLPRPPDRGADEPDRLSRYQFVEDRLSRLVREALEKEHISLSRAAEILESSIEAMRERVASWSN